MGQIIPRSAASERIFEVFETSLSNARSREDTIKQTAEARLAPLEPVIAMLDENMRVALGVSMKAGGKLAAADHDSDMTVGAVLDEAWNALGRPAHSIEYNLVAGAGKGHWTNGDPLEQHLLMRVLANNFRASTSSALQAGKEDWAKRIEAKAAVQESVAAAVKAADAVVDGLTNQQRALANLAQVALTRLKRDYKNAGMTETQIHQIIPDYTPRTHEKPAPPASPATPTA